MSFAISLTSLTTKLPAPIARGIGKTALALTKSSPILFAIGGAVLTVGAVIEASRRTPAFLEELEEYNKALEQQKQFKEDVESGKIVPKKPYDKKEQLQDRLSIYAKVVAAGVKHYGRAMLMIGGSFVCYGMALKILNGWFAGASAALAATKEELSHLEENVEKEYGAEVLQKLKGPNQSDMIIEGHVDENGETVVDNVVTTKSYDAYSRLFDEYNCPANWTKSPKRNFDFIKGIESWANLVLRTRGFIFLNEVYQALGFEWDKLSQAGQLVGWRYYDDPKEALLHRAANHVLFSINDASRTKTAEELAFIEGKERSVWLGFNVDPEPIVGALPIN